ncbi:MAG: NAD-dependent deacylase [Candidatus Hermodarchaeota archaeon]
MKRNDNKTKITVITGAGFSKASGIPTFRGKNGLWKTYAASELATPSAFNRDPQLVWEWYRWRIGIVLNASPNAAHYALANYEKQGFDTVILTQNVDDLHERAGSTNVIHLHGQILKAKCSECGKRIKWTIDSLKKSEIIPKCMNCESIYRPDVVWFGESLDSGIIYSCFDRLSQTDVLIVAGTSGVVYPVAEFPFLAKRQNPLIKIYEFNLEYTPITRIATETTLGPVEKTLVEFFSTSKL